MLFRHPSPYRSLLYCFCFFASPAWASNGPICDTLAAHQYDPLKRAAGVQLKEIKAEAIVACLAAAHEYPNEPRYMYQLGRAYDAAGRSKDAYLWHEKAYRLLYPAAAGALGVIHFGNGTKNIAKKYLEEALTGGFVYGAVYLGAMYIEIDDYKNALKYFTIAADKQIPEAIGAVGAHYGYGQGVGQNCRKGLELMRQAILMGDATSKAKIADVQKFCDRPAGGNNPSTSAGQPYEVPNHRRYQAPTPRFCGRGPDGTPQYC